MTYPSEMRWPGREGWRRSLAGLMLMLLALPIVAAQIEVSLDRNPVPLNESFTLTFTASESPDDDPDFTPLQTHFEVLNQSQSSQMSIVNGRATRRISWQVQVMAKQAGKLEIPAIDFGKDRSRPFAVTVTHGAVTGKQGGEASILLEADAEPKNPYVQAQVVLTLRVLSRVAFSGDLGQPEMPETVIDKLDEDREYVTLRDGVQFKVNERRYVLFPQKSGRLIIPSVNLTAQLGASSFGPFFRPSTRQQRLHSDPIELEVRPIPSQFTGKHWLPATRVDLREEWQPASLEVGSGEPVTRTLTIRAEGAGVGMLPELTGSELPATELRQYPDQPVTQEGKTDTGLVSQRQQKTALMAARGGRYALPALEIPWWNTVADRMEIARLPEHELVVSQADVENKAADTSPVQAATHGGEFATPVVAPAEAVGPLLSVTRNPWFWGSITCGLGWLVTALFWIRSRAAQGKVQKKAPPKTESQWSRALELACRANDAKGARQAFDEWAKQRWPEIPPGYTELQLDTVLRSCLSELNRCLFSARHDGWNGSSLLHAMRQYVSEPNTMLKNKKNKYDLAPLYKQKHVD